MDLEKRKRKQLQRRSLVFMGIILLIFVFLSARLFYLQVVNAAEYQAQSEENKTRFLSVSARRGDILDAKGTVLATSKPVFSITVTDSGERQNNDVLQRIVDIVGDPAVTVNGLKEKLAENFRPYEPAQVLRLPWNEQSMEIVSKLEARRSELPGVNVEEEPMRYYPEGTLAGHILGYVGSINKDELAKYSDQQYGIHDRIGKSGLELILEKQLRGKKGSRQVEVNAFNNLVRDLLAIPPTPGDNVILTLNSGMQKVLSDSLDRQVAIARQLAIQDGADASKVGGAAGVVMNVRTGAIIAMISKPDINPNDYIEGTAYNGKADYYLGPLSPELNRAVKSAYPPGSTFKPITALAALDSGKIKVTDPPIYDSGAYWEPPFIKCWKPGGHGYVDFFKAFAYSCNTWFQYAGDKAGADEIVKVARMFGLGETTGSADVMGESAGVLPTPAWKKEVSGAIIQKRYEVQKQRLAQKYQNLLAQAADDREREDLSKQEASELRQLEAQYKTDYNWETGWHPYDTFNMSIGQGSNNYTMLQLAAYIAAVANGGKRYQPYLVDKIVAPDGQIVEQRQPKLLNTVDIDPQYLADVRRGMLGVTQPGGTAYARFYDFPSWATSGGKTGSAQTGDGSVHGVYVGFAPYDNPEIAMAIIVEYGQSGSGSAGYVARDVLRHYYGLDKEN